LGFLHPTAGRGRVLGLDTVRDSVAIRRRIGYLPGGIALYDTLTGERLLDYLGELTGRPPVRRRELCDRLELSRQTLKRLVRDYSRGMRQKIGIEQALQHDPELAILDEPSEGLDPLMQRAFYEILDALKAEGRTIFFSSHVLSEVERVCDRVAIVRQGRLVALEETAVLLARRKRNVQMRFSGVPPRLDGVRGVSAVEWSDGNAGGPEGPHYSRPEGPHDSRPEGAHDIRPEPHYLVPVRRRRPISGGDRGCRRRGPHDRARAPRGGLPRVLRRGRPLMNVFNWTLFRQTWRFQRVRLALVSIALAVWGFLLPVIYARFGSQFSALMNSGLLPKEFAEFGGGDVFSLSGAIALSFIIRRDHPDVGLCSGFSSAAVAGERQKGTLKGPARPISRQAL
jgi:ABC-type Na+ transport system ATPase subunit NatA